MGGNFNGIGVGGVDQHFDVPPAAVFHQAVYTVVIVVTETAAVYLAVQVWLAHQSGNAVNDIMIPVQQGTGQVLGFRYTPEYQDFHD
jgi:hypothetical protein